jgi:hypothetical protein
VQIPRSIAGDYWGGWSVVLPDKNIDLKTYQYPATFLILHLQPKAAGLTVEEVEIPRGPLGSPKEFRYNDQRPMIGAKTVIDELQLVSPLRLAFHFPIEEIEWPVEFEARDVREAYPRLLLDLGQEKTAEEIEVMRKRRLAHFEEQMKQVDKDKTLSNMFRFEDVKNLRDGKKDLLGRYKFLTSPPLYEAFYKNRYKALKTWTSTPGEKPAIDLYPIQTILFPNPPDQGNFDATPTRPTR